MNIEELIKNWTPLSQAQKIIASRDRMAKLQKDIIVTDKRIIATENSKLEEIDGIGQATAQKLLDKWIKNKEDLIALGFDGVKEIITSPISLKKLKDNLFSEEKEEEKEENIK